MEHWRGPLAGLELVQFSATALPDVWAIQLEPLGDERGAFMRLWGAEEFASHGISKPLVACNLSTNTSDGTLRGMHFQVPPYAEAKVVQCARGAIYDVVIDLRKNSPTFCRWHGEVLSETNRRALYVPEGLAHGFLTLDPASEVLYFMTAPYSGEHARGVRWDDPAFRIEWPDTPSVVSERDLAFPDFDPHIQWETL